MNLSVIIPMYNCEKFISKAIESVLIQNEVDEIILVEDCSPDNTINIANNYAQKHPKKIKLIKNEKNLGCAESRNIGIKLAKGFYIGFLDADDYYLPERFKASLEMLKNNPELDGVFGSLGVEYLNSEIEKTFGNKYRLNTTIRGDINPNNILEKLLKGKSGWIHLNTLTLKKSIIEKIEYFDKELQLGEDMHFIFKILLGGKLDRIPTKEPIAVRGLHYENRITKTSWKYHTKIIPKLFKSNKNNSIFRKYKFLFILKHLCYLKKAF